MLSLFPRAQTVPRLEEHYGLAQRPFALTLDQQFVFHSQSYAAALADVRRALDRRDGLVVVTGDTGTGKTMLCRTLIQQLDAAACVSVVLDPRVTVEDLLRHVLADFGVIVPPRGLVPTRHQLMRALQRCLASLAPTGACAVLVVDEAQHLAADVLQQLCLLLNLETNESKLLQVVLVGHTSLNDVLERPELRQLHQRVARRCTLEPLAAAEVKGYIRHRLARAQRLALAADVDALRTGAAAIESVPCTLSFTASALRAVVRQSHGIPRLVNVLCDRALEIGYERRTHTIDARIARAATRRVAARVPGCRPAQAVRAPRGAARATLVAAALAGAVGFGMWHSIAHGDTPTLPSPPVAFAATTLWSPPPNTDVTALEVFDRLDIWNGPLTTEPNGIGDAAGVRLLRVVLLRSADRISLALEMTAEPQKAALRTLSDRVLELDTGPVSGPVGREALAPSSSIPILKQVSIREYNSPISRDRFLRARVLLREPGRGDVRIVGRVVYIDLTALNAGPPA